MILLCMRCYFDKDVNEDKDFMASSLVTPADILKSYSKCYFLFCERDPLHDDIIRFISKLL